MEPLIGTVVPSKAGRDKGSYLAVTGFSDGELLLCDGKERPLERPKRKKQKHVALTAYTLSPEELMANGRIRKALNRLSSNTDKD